MANAAAGKSFVQEFMEFLKTFGVIGLAIAFIIGQAASTLITALVNDIINPFVGLLLPSGDLKTMSFSVGNSVFMYGDLVSNLINFLIIAVVVFVVYKQLARHGFEVKKK